MNCLRCKSIKIQKFGKVPTVKGKKQRYRCGDCGHTFY